MTKRIVYTFIFFLLIPLYTGAVNISDFLKEKVVVRKLSNGITLVMMDRGYAPTLAFNISFKVGSCDESYFNIGAAHLLEHMLFKGTDKIGTTDYKSEKVLLRKIEALGETIDKLTLSNPQNIMLPEMRKQLKDLEEEASQYVISSHYDKIYTENGGVGFNASTSRDKTGYYIELPADRLKLWAELESERLLNPVFREYYTERENVFQERLMRYDSIGEGLFFEQFLAEAFLIHPYRHPTIGWKSNIHSLSLVEIRKFFRQYYIPSKMTITIVGKQDVNETHKIVKEYFEKIPSKPEPRGIALREEEPEGGKRFTLRYDSNPCIIMGWRKPAFPNKDDAVLDIASDILSGGKSSRLYRSLVVEKKMASRISAWNGTPGSRYENLFVVYAAPAAEHTCEELETEIYKEIETLKSDVSIEEMNKVKNGIESQAIFSLNSNSSVAGLLSHYQTIHGDWKYFLTAEEMYKGITPQDVKNAVSKYLVKENAIVGILEKPGAKNEENK